MHHLLSNLIVYQSLREDYVLSGIAAVSRELEELSGDSARSLSQRDADRLRSQVFQCVHRIMEQGTTYGFEGDLWADYISLLLMTDENPLALVSEKREMADGSASYFANHDFSVIQPLMNYDFSPMEKLLGIDCLSTLKHYHSIRKPERMYFSYISQAVNRLSRDLCAAADTAAFSHYIRAFYRDYGVGMFGLNKAFRIIRTPQGTPALSPINNLEQVNFDDLVGYEFQKQQVYKNTQAFLEGRGANNVLLYGDAGTGKSTTVKATLNEFYPQGLRLIEIYKHQFQDLAYVISTVKNRNYKFILFMDDLSFEEFEIEYKYLKAVIEGGFETRPDNILIYATSNRRHLIKENLSDRKDMVDQEDIHHSDTIEEKLSLVDRFGLNLLYTRPTFDEYHEIVLRLAEKHGITTDRDSLLKAANAWSVRKGGYTGRIAQQFINSLNPPL
jgi:predicted AAA+ superfamily ATPase